MTEVVGKSPTSRAKDAREMGHPGTPGLEFTLPFRPLFVVLFRTCLEDIFSDWREAEWENVLMTTSLPQREQLKIDKLLAQIIKLKAAGSPSDDRPKGGTARPKNLSSASPWHLES